MKEHELIIGGTSVIIPMIIYTIKNTLPESVDRTHIIISLMQYTNWNLILIFINYFRNNRYLNVFIAINSTTIFTVYHLFHFTNKALIKTLPNIPKDATDFEINVANFFLHVLPFLVYINSVNKYNYIIDSNVGYNVILFTFVWALQCFQSLDPHVAYFKISDDNVYRLWIFIVFYNIFLGNLLYRNSIFRIQKTLNRVH